VRLLVFLAVGVLLLASAAFASDQNLVTRFERAVGESVKEQLIATYGGKAQIPLHEHLKLEAIFNRLTSVVSGNEDYSLTILDSYEINAFSLPGGYIFLTKGLLKLAGSDEQRIAGALAHEIAHVANKHGMNALWRRLGLSVLLEVGKFVLEVTMTEAVHAATQALIDVLQSGYSREAELEADYHAQKYMMMAGFDPAGLIHVLSDLQRLPQSQEVGAVFRSHPDPGIRIQQLLETLSDYWLSPQPIAGNVEAAEPKRGDPLNRFLIVDRSPGGETTARSYTLYDQQNQDFVGWLDGLTVNDLAFAPDGSLIAAGVWEKGIGDVWIWNRQGKVVERWKLGYTSPIDNLHFDPSSSMLVYQLRNMNGVEIWVGYLGEVTRLKLSCRLDAELVAWQESGLVLKDRAGSYYRIQAPRAEPIRLADPIPQVIERKQRLVPQVGQDANGLFRLTPPGNSGF